MMMVASWVCVQHPNPVQYHCDEPAGSMCSMSWHMDIYISQYLLHCSQHDPNVDKYTVPHKKHFRIWGVPDFSGEL